MNLRDQVTTAALIGGHTFEPDGGPLDSYVAAISQREPAQRTLDAIALVTAYEEAGSLPLPPPAALPRPCEPDPRPRCGAIAAGHLSELLADPRGLLAEWLALANERGLRPPEELVPGLLRLAGRDPALRESVAVAAGPLGVWLSHFRDEWAWVRASSAGESAWETGTFAERLSILRRVRESNPDRGRALLEATWQTEPADARRQFLEALAIGLGPADEAFLEACLDDRGASVRRSAAERLGSLPESALTRRMTDRLAGRLRLRSAGLLSRKKILEVTPFEGADPAMIRDGIEKDPPAGAAIGQRAWWTARALAAVPPSHWTRQLGASPPQLIEAAKNSDWKDALLEGWQTAAIRHRDQDWLTTFARDATLADSAALVIYRALEPAERERCLLAVLGEDPNGWILRIEGVCPHPWSESFTRSVLKAAKAPPKDVAAYHFKLCQRAFAVLASTEGAPPPDEAFGDHAALFHFRREMRNALRNQENS